MKEGGEIIVIDYHHSSPRISFFLDSIIASPSAYGGRYAGCRQGYLSVPSEHRELLVLAVR